ncbi:MAG TPA: hypothetical protein VJQ79_10370 [Acidimicrobiia bacterium]|nr:hypothetical protein [Acidimicrobiia bacterium]
MNPLYRESFDRLELATRYPARFTHPNKLAFLATVEGEPPPGTIEVARWATDALPSRRGEHRPAVEARRGYFTYHEPDTESEMHWHLNFANYDLFSAYAGSLLAQDEMQVLEHPDLARVREALLGEGRSTLVTDQGLPTPFTLIGVPRRGVIDTAPSPARPHGLYGNRFSAAPVEQVLQATTRIDPATISNLVAIEAPAYGSGEYRREEITGILRTALTGFGAASVETHRIAPQAATVIHTGWWGCGAYGGNQELMALLQLLAAEWAEAKVLYFYLGEPADAAYLAGAQDVLDSLPIGMLTDAHVAAIADRRYLWGVSDGN